MEEARNDVVVATEEDEMTLVQKDNTVIDFKMVTFSLAGKDYAIDIMHVKEIAKAGRFTYVPNTLPFVLGVYNLRGEIIPILDLRLFFNIEIPERDDNKLENMLILSVDDQKFGVVVDKIDKVIGVQRSSIQPPHPLFGDINIKYIDGIIESHNNLYVLLDVTRIFATKEVEGEDRVAIAYARSQAMAKEKTAVTANASSDTSVQSKPTTAPVSASAPSQSLSTSASIAESEKKVEPVADNAKKYEEEEKINAGIQFIKENLAKFKNFFVTSVNETWVRRQFIEWTKLKGEDKNQLLNEAEANEFLKSFWSTSTEDWWSKEYADSLYNLLPDNSAKQLIVWNPGCGKGNETYSLACLLAKRYPEAKIRIYAQDVDLLKVSNAALMSVPDSLAADWYSPYLTKKANGEYTFSQDIKDSIMFEYHDCKNTNALPMVDIIFARDVLSLLDDKSQEAVVSDFLEKMKGNAVAIIGENEAMPSSFTFGENSVGALVAYTKD